MSVHFIKDQDRDIRLMWELFLPQTEDANGRAKEAGISVSDLERARRALTVEEALKIFERLAELRYAEDADILERAMFAYKAAWDRIDRAFFCEVEAITGHAWQFSEYFVVMSLFHHGVSNSNENIVVRWAYEGAEDQKRITAHEILMIQLWYIFDQYFPEAEKDELGYFWALNEITATAILGLEPSLHPLWTPQTQGYDPFLQNYPQLHEFKRALKEKYQAKTSFRDYLNDAVGFLAGHWGK